MTRPDEWFRPSSGGPWHHGFGYARCGVQTDVRSDVTDLRPVADRPLADWCGECYVDLRKSYLRKLDEEIAESTAERDEYLRTVEARRVEWETATGHRLARPSSETSQD